MGAIFLTGKLLGSPFCELAEESAKYFQASQLDGTNASQNHLAKK